MLAMAATVFSRLEKDACSGAICKSIALAIALSIDADGRGEIALSSSVSSFAERETAAVAYEACLCARV